MKEQEVEQELERRLALLETPDHEDPARKGLPATDPVVRETTIAAGEGDQGVRRC